MLAGNFIPPGGKDCCKTSRLDTSVVLQAAGLIVLPTTSKVRVEQGTSSVSFLHIPSGIALLRGQPSVAALQCACYYLDVSHSSLSKHKHLTLFDDSKEPIGEQC